MFRPARLVLPAALAALLLAPVGAFAHFPFLFVTNDGGGAELRLTFGEDADADDPAMLPILERAEVLRRTPDGAVTPVTLTPEGGVLAADVAGDPAGTVYTLAMTYGVMDRGDGPFLLEYCCAAMKERTPADAGRPAAVNAQPLAVVPEPGSGSGGVLKVLAAGVPAAGAEVNVAGDLTNEDLTTGPDGAAELPADAVGDGRLSVRAKVVVPGSGVYEGEAFSETRRYATAVLSAGDFQPAEPAGTEPADETAAVENQFTVVPVAGAELPEGVSSLGAAVSDGHLYYYGGHPGTPHQYSTDEQSGSFRRLNLADPAVGWEDLPAGPKLQGLAMTAHPAGGVLRIGGFTARNSLDEESDYHSMPTVSHYDPAAGEWTDLAPLPEGRSSFDAALLGDKVYVLGGWRMAGAAEEQWLTRGYVADLTQNPIEWEELPTPPQARRALSVAAVPEAGDAGKIYMIGGMLPEGEPTRRADVFDVANQEWESAPNLNGGVMDGFGTASFAADGAVYTTTLTGTVQRLAPGSDAWEDLGELPNARFFHRLLPVPAAAPPTFLLIGGGSMEEGRFTAVERLTVGG